MGSFRVLTSQSSRQSRVEDEDALSLWVAGTSTRVEVDVVNIVAG